MMNRIALTLVFTLSFLSYTAPDLTVSLQFAPLVMFAALVFVRVLLSDSVLQAVESLFATDGLLFVILVAFLVVIPSIESSSSNSLEIGLLIAGCLILARLYMAVVPVREVLEAYFWSGILSVGIFIFLGLTAFVQSLETLERFSPFSFHPNLLAFLLAGYFCVMVWKVMSPGRGMKILAGLAGLACLVIIFFASSRGSIVGVLVGCAFAGGVAIVRARREQRIRLVRPGLLTITVLLLTLILVRDLEWANDAFGFVDQVLQLSNEYRGLDTGLTGRVDKWETTMQALSGGNWLIGRGIRSSDAMTDDLIDNSYLVIVYEIGLIPLVLITWRFLSISGACMKGYFRASTARQRYFYLTCCMLMGVFLTNNIVARFLFSVGNPFSLLALFLFAMPTLHFEAGGSKLPGRFTRRLAPEQYSSS